MSDTQGFVKKWGELIAIVVGLITTITFMNSKFDKMEERINIRFEKVDQRFEKIDQRFEKIDQRFEKIEERLNNIENRLTRVETVLIIGGMLPRDVAVNPERDL